eukprot:GAHX01000107.1.p1 GENE.GAHX01000107.1~~GAHX01000107.1.p1  ORF type:complete len:471 (-),score=90.49 GAHX01000107.1:66-1436(-)
MKQTRILALPWFVCTFIHFCTYINTKENVLIDNIIYSYFVFKNKPRLTSTSSYNFILLKAMTSAEGTCSQSSFLAELKVVLFRVEKVKIKENYASFPSKDHSLQVLKDLLGKKYGYKLLPVRYTNEKVLSPFAYVFRDLNFEMYEDDLSQMIADRYAHSVLDQQPIASKYICMLSEYMQVTNGNYRMKGDQDHTMSTDDCMKFEMRYSVDTEHPELDVHFIDSIRLVGNDGKALVDAGFKERNLFTYDNHLYNFGKFKDTRDFDVSTADNEDVEFVNLIEELVNTHDDLFVKPKSPLKVYSSDFWKYISGFYNEMTEEAMKKVVTCTDNKMKHKQNDIKVEGDPTEKLYAIGMREYQLGDKHSFLEWNTVETSSSNNDESTEENIDSNSKSYSYSYSEKSTNTDTKTKEGEEITSSKGKMSKGGRAALIVIFLVLPIIGGAVGVGFWLYKNKMFKK